jgi:hypothetical protein
MNEATTFNREDGAWHLDRKVPIGLMLGLVIQTITLVYVGTSWKSDIDHRLVVLEKNEDLNIPQESRLVVLEQKFNFIQETLSRIDRKLDEKLKP